MRWLSYKRRMKWKPLATDADWEGIVDPASESYRLAWSEEALRKFCACSVKANPSITPLKSITIVGGLFLNFNEPNNNETNRDTYYLVNVLQYLMRTGIPVDPKFELHLANILHGEDYLQTNYKTDLLILGFLPKYGAKELLGPDADGVLLDQGFEVYSPYNAKQNGIRSRFQKALKRKLFDSADCLSDDHFCVVSPQSTPDNWRERLAKAQPKLVFTFHRSSHEIDVGKLGLNSLVEPIVDPSARPIRVDCAIAAEAEFSHNTEVRRGWKIFTGTEFLRDTAPHVWGFTMLGQHMQATAKLAERPPVVDVSKGYYLTDGTRWSPRAPYSIPLRESHSGGADFLKRYWAPVPRPWHARYG